MINWTAALLSASSFLFFASTFLYGIRMKRFKNRLPLAIVDTCVITLAFLALLATFIVLIIMSAKGLLRPYSETRIGTDDGVRYLYKTLKFAWSIATRAVQVFAKISLGINCFHAAGLVRTRWYKWCTLAVLVLMVLNISTLALTTAYLIPVSKHLSPEAVQPATGLNPRVVYVVQNTLGFFTTLVLILAGTPILFKVSSFYKFAGVIMFLLGFIALGIQALQLALVINWEPDATTLADAHWRDSRWMMSASFAFYLLFLCACLPCALVSLFEVRTRAQDPTELSEGGASTFKKSPAAIDVKSVAASTLKLSYSNNASPTYPMFPGVILGGPGASYLSEDGDTADWLGPHSPMAVSFEQRLGAFQQRRGDWEDLYATDGGVEIRAFEDQFPAGTISQLPFAAQTASAAAAEKNTATTTERETDIESDPVAKTQLQKAYFDEMVEFRRHFNEQAAVNEQAADVPFSEATNTPANERIRQPAAAGDADGEIFIY